MQVLARCLARQQADKRRDQSALIGCTICALRRLRCRLEVARRFLFDVHASAFCIDARATCSS
jgi:hypothetical protein